MTEIEFNRPQKYELVEELGRGACGETVKLRDVEFGIDFVCKKFSPIIDHDDHREYYEDLLRRFRDEARILFHANHPYVVRIFNYFSYPERKTAYILMEYVDGADLIDFLRASPNLAGECFAKTITGFQHLEANDILHRDIRPANLLIRSNGEPKIIDFGFGKSIKENQSAEGKSISLNLWCAEPIEYQRGLYNRATEVYFVGKLFEMAIRDNKLSDFPYFEIVSKMCKSDPSDRYSSFSEVQSAVDSAVVNDLDFSTTQTLAYRAFADELAKVIIELEQGAKIFRDHDGIIGELKKIYRDSMMEKTISRKNNVIRLFIRGSYWFSKQEEISVKSVRGFIELVDPLSTERRAIVFGNLAERLESIPRRSSELDDEIPF